MTLPDPNLGAFYAFVPGAEPIPPLPVAGIRFAALVETALPALAAAMGVPEAEPRRRLALDGFAALALLDDGGIAGYGWVSLDAMRIYELGLEIPLPDGHAYIWDCATLQPYRGRGVFAGLLRFLMEELRLQGIVEVWAAVEPGNAVSARAFTRAGFRLAAETPIVDGALAAFQPTTLALPAEIATLAAFNRTL